MTGACDRSSHRSNRVAVTAERRRRQACLPWVIRMQCEHREGGRYRFLRGQAGPNQLDDIAPDLLEFSPTNLGFLNA